VSGSGRSPASLPYARRRVADPTFLRPQPRGWAGLRQNYLDVGAQPALPGQEPSTQDGSGDGDTGETVPRRLSHQAAARAELDAVAAVGVARMALTDAVLAVLQARPARIQAGEDQPDSPAIDGHVPLHGCNPVSRHGPALARGLSGDQVRAHPHAAEHAQGPGVARWPSACSTSATSACSSGTGTISGCPSWAVLSVWLPTRDEPIRQRRRSGSLK
jgi:hypothetical protein